MPIFLDEKTTAQKMNLEYGKAALEKKEAVLLEQPGRGDFTLKHWKKVLRQTRRRLP
jgi:hypothetical protein